MSKAIIQKKRNFFNFSSGIGLMLIATFCFTIMQSLVKELTPMHTFQITFFRSAITSSCCFSYLFYYQLPVVGNNQKILIGRALLGIISMTCFFFTLQWMPFGASVSLKYLSPVFAAIVAFIFLKEKIKPIQWGLLIIALSGVFLLKGFDSRITFWGLIIGLTGAIAGGLVYPLIRYIGKTEHPIVIINYFMFIATLLLGVLMIPFWENPSTQQWMLLFLMGFTGFFAQFFMTKAFQLGEVNLIAPIKYTEVVYALLIGWIWYGESYTLWSLIGIVLIITAMLFNLKYKE